METTSCEWGTALYLIFSENVGPLVYYSHLLPLLSSLLLGSLVLIRDKKLLANRILFFVTFVFGLWAFFDLILWASPSPEAVMFFWSIIVPVEMLMYVGTLYLVYVFANEGRDVPLRTKLLAVSFFIPILLLTHTSYNVTGLSPDCDEGAIEGPLIKYLYIVEFIYILWIAGIVSKQIRTLVDGPKRQQMMIVGGAAIVFLTTFSAGNITLAFSLNPLLEQYKLFGMPLFVAIVFYSMVRFQLFNVKLLATEAFVSLTGILLLSLLFLRTMEIARPVIIMTNILFIILGFRMVQTVRHETALREKGEQLARYLANANKRLRELDRQKTEFVSIASHQLRAPVAAIRGYASMIEDGTYGKVPKTLVEPMGRVSESGRRLALMIDDFLNVSRIEQGRMVYDMKRLDLVSLVDTVYQEQRLSAEKKNLTCTFVSQTNALWVTGDEGKLKQIISNIVDNAIKYTKVGGVTVTVRGIDSHRSALVEIEDTGIGIVPQEQEQLFHKFKRATNANEANVYGTGLGLYIAKEIVRGHNGWIHVSSPGVGKGSKFSIELPYAKEG
jgi:signal transduction histidine kinase